jgi:hypothetical protein
LTASVQKNGMLESVGGGSAFMHKKKPFTRVKGLDFKLSINICFSSERSSLGSKPDDHRWAEKAPGS